MSNTIIKASAGSGKTFQLSNEFLSIVLHADGERVCDKIAAILASTFTRKAAGEILDRILNRLAEAALDEEAQKRLAEQIPLPVKDKKKCTALLQRTVAEIAQNLYRMRISTLDSFFNKIASSFSLELALPPGWAIIEETDYQRSIHEAVQEVFEESHKNEARKLLNLLQKGEQSQTVTQEIINLAKDMLPLVRSSDAGQWDHTDTDKLGKLTLGKMTENALDCIAVAFAEDRDALHQLLPKTQKGMPDGNCVKDFDRFMQLARTSNWEGLLAAKIGNNFALGNPVIRNKPAESELCRIIEPIVRHAQAVWAETIIHQTAATRALLDLVWEKLKEILQRKRGFRFEDITFCLGEMFLRKPNALPQRLLSHRIDAETKHLLLDEFQDTSLPQWSILKPFVQPVVTSKGTSFFCVGDLKQAIYGWRGGVAEIFETVSDFLESEGAEPPKRPVMNETRRNSQAVIDAVNLVFLNLETNAAVCEKSPAAAAKWQEWFGSELHETKSPSKEKGYCVLETVDNAADDDSEESIDTESPFWKYTLDRIQQLRGKHPHRSIGILFRAGKDIPTVIKGLKSRKIEASDEGGVPLTDSAAVQHVLSVMTLIDHPGDTIVRFHLANGPLAALLPLHDFGDDSAAERVAHRWREKLLSQGYGKTLKEFMPALTPCESKEQQRLEKLLELAYRFDEQAVGTRTRPFIETVNAARMATPGAASVRVMTIHGAKGLEFDIVVLPDLEGTLVGMPPKVVVAKKSPTAPVDFVLRWVSQDLRSLLPEKYQQVFVQWQDDQVKESLAVLYVAMTRARHELVMIVPEKSRKGIGTYAGVLRAGLDDGRQTADGRRAPAALSPKSILYEKGNADWDDTDWDDEVSVEKTEPPVIVWNPLSEQRVLRNLPRATPSGMVKGDGKRHTAHGSRESETSEPAIAPPETAALRGTAIHACFASIQWLDENLLTGTPVPVAAQRLQAVVEQSLAGKRNGLEPSEIVSGFFAICEQPEVRKILMRSSYPAEEEITVEPERRFAVRWQDKLLHGSMDRLLVRRRGDEVVGLEIIDFKTDRPMDGESEWEFLAERQRAYTPQIEAYCQAAKKMYPKVESRNISAKIVFTSVDKAVNVG